MNLQELRIIKEELREQLKRAEIDLHEQESDDGLGEGWHKAAKRISNIRIALDYIKQDISDAGDKYIEDVLMKLQKDKK